MSRPDIHDHKDLNTLRLSNIPAHKRREIAQKAFTFMFARNPFHRVFSGYIDKIFVLRPETKAFVEMTRIFIREAHDVKLGLFKYKIADTHSHKRTEYNVTFAEALLFATRTTNGHFSLVSKQCDPCVMDFDVPGRLETMDSDSQYVLDKINRSNVLGYDLNDEAFKLSQERVFIRNSVQRLFVELARNPVGTTKYKALVRIWKLFHIQGFINDSIKYPLDPLETYKAKDCDIIHLAYEAMRVSGDPTERRAQRQKYYLQAFRSVPLADLLSFSTFAMPDCRLFGYDCYPEEIFKGRQEGDEKENIFSSDKILYQDLPGF